MGLALRQVWTLSRDNLTVHSRGQIGRDRKRGETSGGAAFGLGLTAGRGQGRATGAPVCPPAPLGRFRWLPEATAGTHVLHPYV